MGMSGVLKNKRFIVLIGVIIILLSILYNIWLTILLVAFFLFLLLNFVFRKQFNKDGFSFYRNKRGADYLIIGDYATIPDLSLENSYVLKYMAPGRTLLSSFEISKRLFSILNKKGTLIIIVDEDKLCDLRFSIFDYAFLHPIQLKKYNIEYLRLYNFFPLIFAPIRVLKKYSSSIKVAEEPSSKIYAQNDFCKYIRDFWEERNVNFKLLVIK